jgi:hypothetical protein
LPKAGYFLLFSPAAPVDNAATNASWGTSTRPKVNTYPLLARRPKAAYFFFSP